MVDALLHLINVDHYMNAQIVMLDVEMEVVEELNNNVLCLDLLVLQLNLIDVTLEFVLHKKMIVQFITVVQYLIQLNVIKQDFVQRLIKNVMLILKISSYQIHVQLKNQFYVKILHVLAI